MQTMSGVHCRVKIAPDNNLQALVLCAVCNEFPQAFDPHGNICQHCVDHCFQSAKPDQQGVARRRKKEERKKKEKERGKGKGVIQNTVHQAGEGASDQKSNVSALPSLCR